MLLAHTPVAANTMTDLLSVDPRGEGQSDDSRASAACDRCHRRKAKCDRAQPACASCTKAKVACIYIPRDPNVRRQEVEKLERRLHQLEAKNKALASQLREEQRASSHGRPQDLDDIDLLGSRPLINDTVSGGAGNREVENQVSYLSLSAGGDRSYLGSASGLLLASLLQANLKSQCEPETNGTPSPANRGRYESGVRSAGSTPDASMLPREKLARSLVDAYFAHDHLCYPFLHPQSVFTALEALYSDATFYMKHPFEGFTVDMIFAISTAQVYKFDWAVLPSAETHHDRAMTRLSAVLGRGGIEALQAVLLICQYRMASSLYDTSASLWHLIGTAARMCVEMGMHRELFYKVPVNTSAGLTKEALVQDVEIKLRCFWCVVAMDRIASITLGRPLALQLEDIDAELPQAGPATDLTSPDGPLSPTESLDSPLWHFRNAIFVAITRYRVLCGKVLSSLHGIKKPTQQDSTDIREVRRQLVQQLEEWRLYISELPLPVADVSSTMPQDQSSFRSREWYDLLYHNCVLMLYRPSPALSDATQSSNTLQKLFDASRQSITLYGYLHRSRKINYSWITLHSLFIAGLSYIYAVRSHFQCRWHQRNLSHRQFPVNEPSATLVEDPSITQIVNETRACSNVLVAVSERWSSARNCSLVFGRLSDAVLSDIVQFQTGGKGQIQRQNTTVISPDSMAGPFTSPVDMYHQHCQQQQTQTHQNLMVDNTLQDCYDELQSFYGDQFGSDSIMQLSQDWMFEIQNMEYSGHSYTRPG